MTTVLDSSLNLNQSHGNSLICKVTNEFASFCKDNSLRQMAIFKLCQNRERISLTCFFIKTSKILYDMSL